MGRQDALDRGRDAFERHAWGDAYSGLTAADAESPLAPDDLERLAVAAYLIGREDDPLWARAHHEFLRRGETARAARGAFWLGFGLIDRGEFALGGGWLARAARLLEDAQLDCVEQGYLLIPAGLQTFEEGDVATAYGTFSQAAKIADRFGDPDLAAIAGMGRGASLIWLGETAEGMALLDEVMVAVTAQEVSALVTGIVYCAAIEACWDIFDVRRAKEWTAGLSRWCAAQPELVPFRGQCLVHRVEIMQLRGEWEQAKEEVKLACQQLAGRPAIGNAFYLLGELHRLRGELAEAEVAYRQASECGRTPQPGMARLRLAQGRADAAATTIRRVLDEANGRVARARLLVAYVDIMLAAGEVAAARTGVAELADTAAEFRTPFLDAVSSYAAGAVLLAEDDARAACEALRRSWMAWAKLDVPYEVARTRVLMGVACHRLGDVDSGHLERDAAQQIFRQLGATPDLARTEALWPHTPPKPAGGLTAREVEVIALVATGEPLNCGGTPAWVVLCTRPTRGRARRHRQWPPSGRRGPAW